jgi:threonylcarbamoyladenosine tRNA methylthiotransferase MtaB
VNTCAVTAEAASDSRQKIRQAARAALEMERPSELVVTGCWATLEPTAAGELTGVTRVVPNQSKDGLVAEVLGLPVESFDREPVAREPLPGAHLRTRAFIKVQDGCDNRCTFCVTTIARGPGRSREAAQVLDDARSALSGGAQELVLTGVHMGSWGQDFERPARLYDLVEFLLGETDLKRLRLSSLEPWDLDGAFFNLWSNVRLCRHLHLPLQSGSAATLRRMARKTTPESFRKLIESARSACPDMAITTDLIVGFPGETENDFLASLEYVRRANFAGGHVFTYSARPGTAAARMPGQVPHETRKRRNAEMRMVLDETARTYRANFLGTEQDVLWESTDSFGPEGWRLHGLTGNYLTVLTHSKEKLWNEISRVRLVKDTVQGFQAEIVSTGAPPHGSI